MKKSFFIACMAMPIFLLSCGENDTPSQEVSQSSTTQVQNTQEAPSNTSENASNTEEKLNTTMMEVFKKGEPTTCTFQMNSEGQKFQSIMYVDGAKMSYVMTGDMEGQKIENHAVIKDGFSYSWNNMMKNGIKVKADMGENMAGDVASEGSGEGENQEMNEKFEFTCKKGVDAAQFEPPSDITFQEMPDISGGMMGK